MLGDANDKLDRGNVARFTGVEIDFSNSFASLGVQDGQMPSNLTLESFQDPLIKALMHDATEPPAVKPPPKEKMWMEPDFAIKMIEEATGAVEKGLLDGMKFMSLD